MVAAGAIHGYGDDVIQACLSSDLNMTARRPRYSVLGTQRGQLLRPIDDALGRFMKEYRRPPVGWSARPGLGEWRSSAPG